MDIEYFGNYNLLGDNRLYSLALHIKVVVIFPFNRALKPTPYRAPDRNVIYEV